MNKDKLSALIKSPDLERMALILSKPNIFEILRAANTEIRHSNFLAWILDPNNSHNLKAIVAALRLEGGFVESIA